ncbi:MAG TPA: cytosine deaminase, partial [Anaerolineales bacterium]|nr:cytosine deaminase [Anaerolineales bacterium]
MAAQFEILVKHAKLRNSPESLIDIGIANGQIISLEENLVGNSESVIDARGNLVTESFVNPHLHLCKVYTLQMMDEEALTAYQG